MDAEDALPLDRERVLGTQPMPSTLAASNATTQDAEADRTIQRDVFMGLR